MDTTISRMMKLIGVLMVTGFVICGIMGHLRNHGCAGHQLG
jgi:hypothetical protein